MKPTLLRFAATFATLVAMLAAPSPAADLDDVEVRLEPCKPFPIVAPGATGTVAYVLRNAAPRPLELTWSVEITGAPGKPLRQTETLTLAPAQEQRIAMPDLVATRRGVVSFAWTLRDQNGRSLTLADTLAVMTLPGPDPDPARRDRFRFGWGTSLVHFVTDEYLELLRATAREIKAVDPGLQVLNGGIFTLAPDQRHELNPDMARRIVGEAQDAFDILATLNDAAPGVLSGPWTDLRKALKTPKPLWITRVEQRGATPDELVRRLVSAKGSGANAFLWMWGLSFDSGWRGLWLPTASWKVKARKPINQHSFFQMLPAGCAYVHAIGLLREVEPEGRLEPRAAGDEGFWFRNGDGTRKVLVAWNTKGDFERIVTVGGGARCQRLDLYGNETPMAADAQGRVAFPMSQTPAYLVVPCSAPLPSPTTHP